MFFFSISHGVHQRGEYYSGWSSTYSGCFWVQWKSCFHQLRSSSIVGNIPNVGFTSGKTHSQAQPLSSLHALGNLFVLDDSVAISFAEQVIQSACWLANADLISSGCSRRHPKGFLGKNKAAKNIRLLLRFCFPSYLPAKHHDSTSKYQWLLRHGSPQKALSAVTAFIPCIPYALLLRWTNLHGWLEW